MIKSRIIIFFPMFIFLLTSLIVVNGLTPYGSATSPDSLSYLDMAANLKDGNGLLATDFSIPNSESRSLKEQRAWPPLYPALLSTAVSNSYDVLTVSRISTILLFISMFFVFIIVSSQNNWIIALVSSLLLSITIPIITIYTYVWSETLFIPLLIISTWVSIKYLELTNESNIYKSILLLILLSILILLAYTRYIGIAFVLLLPVIYFMSNREKLDRVLFLIAASIYTLIVGYLLYGNYLATGYISGTPRADSDKTIVENLIDVYQVLIAIIPTSLIFILLSLIISIAIVYIIKKSHMVKIEKKNLRYQAIILMLVAAIYLISIVSLRTYSKFDMLDIRLLSPLFVILFVLITILPSLFDINSKRGTFVYMISAFLIISFSIQGYNQFLVSLENWRKSGTPKHLLSHNLVYNNFTRNPDANNEKKLFSNLIGASKGVIIIDKPLIWGFITGIKCVQKPNLNYSGVLQKINALPRGSLFILSKRQIDMFSEKIIGRNVAYKYMDIGEYIAIQLPIDTSSQ